MEQKNNVILDENLQADSQTTHLPKLRFLRIIWIVLLILQLIGMIILFWTSGKVQGSLLNLTGDGIVLAGLAVLILFLITSIIYTVICFRNYKKISTLDKIISVFSAIMLILTLCIFGGLLFFIVLMYLR
jgi:hypothetical protein